MSISFKSYNGSFGVLYKISPSDFIVSIDGKETELNTNERKAKIIFENMLTHSGTLHVPHRSPGRQHRSLG